jgi:outer membrane protein
MGGRGRHWLGSLVLVLSCLGAASDAQQSPLRLTLEESLELALEQNEDLQMARRDLDKARQQIREARSTALPQVDFSANYTHNWQLPTFVFETPLGVQEVEIGTPNELVGTLSLRQPLYTSGKVGAALAVARFFEAYAIEQLRAAQQSVVRSVDIAFYDLLLARELIRVSDQTQARARSNLEQAESLWRGGRTSSYDLLRAQVQVAQVRPDSIRARGGRELAEIAFKNLLGVPLDHPMDIDGDFQRETTLDPRGLDSLLALGATRSPHLRQANLQLEMLAQGVKIARSAARPSLELSTIGQAQWQSKEISLWNEEMRRSLNTGLSLKIPLFDGFRTGARTAQARQDREKGLLGAAQLQRLVELQIQQAWLELQAAGARLDAQSLLLEQAEAGLELAGSRYARGFGTQLEIIDAQFLQTRAQTELAQARRDRAVALIQLETAVGIIGESP